jgi:hypothetical protein
VAAILDAPQQFVLSAELQQCPAQRLGVTDIGGLDGFLAQFSPVTVHGQEGVGLLVRIHTDHDHGRRPPIISSHSPGARWVRFSAWCRHLRAEPAR